MSNERNRIAIVAGVRTPFGKGGGLLKDVEADDLGAFVVRELMARVPVSGDQVDELIFGNVLQPANSTNIARILAIKGGLPEKVPAYTVNRNCASGMEAITSGYDEIRLGKANIVIAGGTESMSNFPVLFSKKMKEFLLALSKAKSFGQKLSIAATFRPSFLIPETPEISDPICGLTMGQTAENLSNDFHVTRAEQDEFSHMSQERAAKAIASGIFAEEIVPIPIPPKNSTMMINDEGPRPTTIEALAKLKPAFNKLTGTVTAGNTSQVTDGAAAVMLMRESQAKQLGLTPLGYIIDYAYAGLAPDRMGLGPVYATAKLLKQTGLALKDFDLIEINEAFAAQVIAVEKAMASKEFAEKKLGRTEPVGIIDRTILNVNGGAVALGHPLGASGTRLVLTLLKELKRRNKNKGLATLCVGGGQGGAIAVEVN